MSDSEILLHDLIEKLCWASNTIDRMSQEEENEYLTRLNKFLSYTIYNLRSNHKQGRVGLPVSERRKRLCDIVLEKEYRKSKARSATIKKMKRTILQNSSCSTCRSSDYAVLSIYESRLDGEKLVLCRNCRRKENVWTQEKIEAVEFLLKGRICSCGESNPICLVFHHPSEKRFEVSTKIPKLIRKSMRDEELLEVMEEADNCIIYCHNCHITHHGNFINK